MRVIPDRISSLRDRLMYMVLVCPDKFDEEDDDDMDSVFEDLYASINHLQSKLGVERSQKMLEMSREAKTLYMEGNEKEGAWRLQDIMAVMRKKKS